MTAKDKLLKRLPKQYHNRVDKFEPNEYDDSYFLSFKFPWVTTDHEFAVYVSSITRAMTIIMYQTESYIK